MHQLRRNVAAIFRKYADVTSPEVVDLLVYKGREELEVRRRPASYGQGAACEGAACGPRRDVARPACPTARCCCLRATQSLGASGPACLPCS